MTKAYEEMTREELIRELKLNSLRRQATPHFLFNSLNVAVSLTMQSPKSAVRFLQLLALMYRYLLRYGNQYYVPIEQEVEMMQQYFELMRVRHVDSIRLKIEPEVHKLKGNPMPPLSLQGLLENAIRHNTHTKQQPVDVRLYVEHQPDGSAMLCMENDIVPLVAQAKSNGMGLKYINESMKLLFDRDIVVKNDGKVFTVMIPMI